MENQKEFSEENLIALIRTDCHRQPQTAAAKLREVIERLADGNHLAALDALTGLDEDIVCLKVFLTRIARLPVGETLNWDS